MADSKISALTSGGGFQAGDQIPIDRSAANYRVSPIGVPVLVYRYTVTGSDKTSIDTGVDTPDAGSNDWTNGDLLEVWALLRTDEAVALSSVDITLNNDTGGNYDRQSVTGVTSTASAGQQLGNTNWPIFAAGASEAASFFSASRLTIPGFGLTSSYKVAEYVGGKNDTTSGNNRVDAHILTYRSTTAITRLKIIPDTSGKKLKVGSQLLIYKRLAS